MTTSPPETTQLIPLPKSAAFGELMRLMFTRASARAILAQASQGTPYEGKTVIVTHTQDGYTIQLR